MIIQDAIRSGKPFKLPVMKDYLYVKAELLTGRECLYWMSDHKFCPTIPVVGLLSNDWVLMEEPKNILKFPHKPSFPQGVA